MERTIHPASGLYCEHGHGPYGRETHIFLAKEDNVPMQICKSALEVAAFLGGYSRAVMEITMTMPMPRYYLLPGAAVWCLVCAGLSHPKIVSGTVEYLSYNECGEGLWYYYIGMPNRYSKYVCIDPLIQPPKSRGMSRNWVYLTRDEALHGAGLLGKNEKERKTKRLPPKR